MKSIQVSVASGSRDTCMHARRADIANTPWEDPQRTTPIHYPLGGAAQEGRQKEEWHEAGPMGSHSAGRV